MESLRSLVAAQSLLYCLTYYSSSHHNTRWRTQGAQGAGPPYENQTNNYKNTLLSLHS